MQSDGKSLTCLWQGQLKTGVFSVPAPHGNKQFPFQSAVMYLCLGLPILPLSTILLFDFDFVPTVWYN